MTRDFTEVDFKEIQIESHQFHKTYWELMEVYEEKEGKLEFQSINHFNHLLTTVGVIAGFGFAALSNVKNLGAFFASEILFLFLIVMGFYILSSYKKSKEKQIREHGESWHSLLRPRLDAYQEFLNLKITKRKLYEKLNEHDQKVFSFKLSDSTENINLDKYFQFALIVLVLSSILLLLAFADLRDLRWLLKFKNIGK